VVRTDEWRKTDSKHSRPKNHWETCLCAKAEDNSSRGDGEKEAARYKTSREKTGGCSPDGLRAGQKTGDCIDEPPDRPVREGRDNDNRPTPAPRKATEASHSYHSHGIHRIQVR
jgi:hypothetical protein